MSFRVPPVLEDMNIPASITVTPIRVADLLADNERISPVTCTTTSKEHA